MSLVSVDEVIATAQSTMKDADSMSKLIWRQWVCLLAIPELGISSEDVKVVTLYPNNFTVPKPDDLKVLIDIACYDANGCELKHKFREGNKRIYPDVRLLRTAIVSPPETQTLNGLIPVDVSQDPYSVNLGTNGDKVAAIVMRYYTYPTSDDGLPLIRQEEVLPILFFLDYMWAKRSNENQSEILSKQQTWFRAADKIKAQKKMWGVTNEVMKTVVNNWMRLIPQMNYELF